MFRSAFTPLLACHAPRVLPAHAAHAASTDLTVSVTKIAGAAGALARRFRL